MPWRSEINSCIMAEARMKTHPKSGNDPTGVGCDRDCHDLVLQKFVMQPGIPVATATRVYRRYLKLEPTHVEEYIAYLKKKVSKGRVAGVARSSCCKISEPSFPCHVVASQSRDVLTTRWQLLLHHSVRQHVPGGVST